MLGARTSTEIATLVAEARAAYALGRGFHQLKQTPRVCTAHNELYELLLVHPQRMHAFVGFKDGELRPSDAAMLPPAMSPAERRSRRRPRRCGRIRDIHLDFRYGGCLNYTRSNYSRSNQRRIRCIQVCARRGLLGGARHLPRSPLTPGIKEPTSPRSTPYRRRSVPRQGVRGAARATPPSRRSDG